MLASRRMRQGKVSDLIHNSEQHPDLQYARVSVHFQSIVDKPDGSGSDVVEGSQLVVSREVRKSSTSTIYRVNDKKKDKEEVVALLKTRGIDLDHNRFLILQGEVEQIAMMKPKAPSDHEDGLLEYLEDIIGSNRLVPKINEALKGMEECNEQRAGKLNALKASEASVRALEPQGRRRRRTWRRRPSSTASAPPTSRRTPPPPRRLPPRSRRSARRSRSSSTTRRRSKRGSRRSLPSWRRRTRRGRRSTTSAPSSSRPRARSSRSLSARTLSTARSSSMPRRSSKR